MALIIELMYKRETGSIEIKIKVNILMNYGKSLLFIVSVGNL